MTPAVAVPPRVRTATDAIALCGERVVLEVRSATVAGRSGLWLSRRTANRFNKLVECMPDLEAYALSQDVLIARQKKQLIDETATSSAAMRLADAEAARANAYQTQSFWLRAAVVSLSAALLAAGGYILAREVDAARRAGGGP